MASSFYQNKEFFHSSFSETSCHKWVLNFILHYEILNPLFLRSEIDKDVSCHHVVQHVIGDSSEEKKEIKKEKEMC